MKKKPVSLELAMSGEVPVLDRGEVVQMPAATPRIDAMEKLTVYVPRAAAKRIKQMALDHDKRVNDFLQEAVDMMMSKYGQPSLKELGLK
jgi:antitoxin-like ribbon-helix-helix protein